MRHRRRDRGLRLLAPFKSRHLTLGPLASRQPLLARAPSREPSFEAKFSKMTRCARRTVISHRRGFMQYGYALTLPMPMLARTQEKKRGSYFGGPAQEKSTPMSRFLKRGETRAVRGASGYRAAGRGGYSPGAAAIALAPSGASALVVVAPPLMVRRTSAWAHRNQL